MRSGAARSRVVESAAASSWMTPTNRTCRSGSMVGWARSVSTAARMFASARRLASVSDRSRASVRLPASSGLVTSSTRSTNPVMAPSPPGCAARSSASGAARAPRRTGATCTRRSCPAVAVTKLATG